MNCRKVVSLLSAYVDGELPGSDMLAIRRHLSECSDCAEEWQSILLTKQAVARLRTAAPRHDFAAAIMARLDEVQVPAYQRLANSIMKFVHGRLSPVAAALTASGLALVILTAGGVDNAMVETGTEMASAPVQARTLNASFFGGLDSSGMSFGSSKPLVVADQSTDFSGSDIHLASLRIR